MNDGELVVAMRLRDRLAFEEFFLRFEPLLLDTALNIGIPAGEREEQVQDLLADVGLALADRDLELPRQLRSYLTRSLRNRWINTARAVARRIRHEHGAAIVAEDAVTAYADQQDGSPELVRRIEPDEEADATLSEPLRRLTIALKRSLTDDERRLLLWANRDVPTRVIANWLGENRSAVKTRIWRLRRRLWQMTQDFATGLSDAERADVERFFGGTPDSARAQRAGQSLAKPQERKVNDDAFFACSAKKESAS